METIVVESIGLNLETKAYSHGITIVTKGLDIDELCALWRKEFTLLSSRKITLLFTDKEYFDLVNQKHLGWAKSIQELFYERGFVCGLLMNKEKN